MKAKDRLIMLLEHLDQTTDFNFDEMIKAVKGAIFEKPSPEKLQRAKENFYKFGNTGGFFDGAIFVLNFENNPDHWEEQ